MQSYGFAAAIGGMLRVEGQAGVDGMSVPGTIALVQGQSVEVSANSSATLSFQQSMIFAVQNTVFKLVNSHELALSRGGLIVTTTEQIRTNVGACGAVMPYGKDPYRAARYEIELQANNAFVYSREMEITIFTKTRAITLPPQSLAVIQNYNGANCTVATYDSLNRLNPAAKMILGGSAAAATAVGFGIGRHQKISAVEP